MYPTGSVYFLISSQYLVRRCLRFTSGGPNASSKGVWMSRDYTYMYFENQQNLTGVNIGTLTTNVAPENGGL